MFYQDHCKYFRSGSSDFNTHLNPLGTLLNADSHSLGLRFCIPNKLPGSMDHAILNLNNSHNRTRNYALLLTLFSRYWNWGRDLKEFAYDYIGVGHKAGFQTNWSTHGNDHLLPLGMDDEPGLFVEVGLVDIFSIPPPSHGSCTFACSPLSKEKCQQDEKGAEFPPYPHTRCKSERSRVYISLALTLHLSRGLSAVED